MLTTFLDAFERATQLHTGISKLLPQVFGTMLVKDFVSAKDAAVLVETPAANDNVTWCDGQFNLMRRAA